MPEYTFDRQSVVRIGNAVRTVERMGGDRNQPAIQYETTTESFRTVILGTFTGEWEKGAEKEVDFTADNGDAKTKTATNYFTQVGSVGDTTDCVIMLAGSEWVLVSADPAGATECREFSKVSPAGNLTLLSAISASGQVVTGVACVNGSLTVTTASLSSLIGYTEQTVRLEDLATVTTQNVTLPPQTGCS